MNPENKCIFSKTLKKIKQSRKKIGKNEKKKMKNKKDQKTYKFAFRGENGVGGLTPGISLSK